MKPAAFEYQRVTSSEEAVECLSAFGEDAKILAGGQSLVPMMNFRLARPSALIDINGIRDLDYITPTTQGLRIGALTRHASLEQPMNRDGRWSFLSPLAHFIGHYPIRTRGTFGGSVVHSDPSAELPTLCVALDADIQVRGPDGSRTVPARSFFKGPFQVNMEPEEMLCEVELGSPPVGARVVVEEIARRAGDFAIVLVIAGLHIEEGVCRWARIGLGGVAGVPVRALDAEALLVGAPLTEEAFKEAAEAAIRELTPPEDIHASAEYRKHVTGVLVRRALSRASEQA
ncbi:MAG: xanthine dehydrogenase family protein subunit M [Actinobacteria bacterium]|nr:xanthine dehydrogenase family protein subunit M [Actinomycetota bacterium]